MLTQKVGAEATPTTVTYTHDLWNRLVQVKYGSDVRAKYTYNGLNWRITKQADRDASGGSGGLDQQRLMYYSANWQLLEERIDNESTFPANGNDADNDQYLQYIWGTRYIDDLVMRRLDANKNGSYADGGAGDKIYYHCTDVQFSTMCVLNDTNQTVERVSYDAYGKARHHVPQDMSGDGKVGADDLLTVNNNWGSVPAPGDINRDGAVNTDDLLAVNTNWGAGIASGKLSNTDNQIGWDGYVYNQELDGGGMYTVRYRSYRPELGRWLERDPSEFADGANLFEGLESNPTGILDPYGTQTTQPAPTTKPSPTQPSSQPSSQPSPQPIKAIPCDKKVKPTEGPTISKPNLPCKSPLECCQEYFRQASNETAVTICCQQKLVACINRGWAPKNFPWPGVADPINDCLENCEPGHCLNLACTSFYRHGVGDPDYPTVSKDCTEFARYVCQYDCLMGKCGRSMDHCKLCNGNVECEKRMYKLVKRLAETRDDFKKKCAPPPATLPAK